MTTEIEKLIQQLELQPHPEGGYFKETYRSEGFIPKDSLGNKYTGPRNYSTCIYFLLTSDTFSAFHKIQQDEFWHFYKGSTIDLHMISPEGKHSKVVIGNDIENGEIPQFVVPGGYWFGGKVTAKDSFALVGCTVSPGFDFADFTLAEREKLIQEFPQHKSIIEVLTR